MTLLESISWLGSWQRVSEQCEAPWTLQPAWAHRPPDVIDFGQGDWMSHTDGGTFGFSWEHPSATGTKGILVEEVAATI